MQPLIAITTDNKENDASSGTLECASAYAKRIQEAGGLPAMLPHETGLVKTYAERFDGFVFTGGGDPHMDCFGCETDPRVSLVDKDRQRFELALLDTLEAHYPDKPVLGICLGMQWMGLRAGGTMDQYTPASMGEEAASAHRHNALHGIDILVSDSVLTQSHTLDNYKNSTVASHHKQVITDSGRMRLVARSTDGLIEAIDDPARPYYLGVQWHPERHPDASDQKLSADLFKTFINFCLQRQ